MVGKTTGNVLLRQEQYKAVQDEPKCISIAAAMTAGKVKNARNVLMRSAREAENPDEEKRLRFGGGGTRPAAWLSACAATGQVIAGA